jgi:hypothetical protein
MGERYFKRLSLEMSWIHARGTPKIVELRLAKSTSRRALPFGRFKDLQTTKVSMMVTGKSANPIRMAWGNSMGIPALARRGVMQGALK